MSKVKVLLVSEWVSESVTRSPIELLWTAKNEPATSEAKNLPDATSRQPPAFIFTQPPFVAIANLLGPRLLSVPFHFKPQEKVRTEDSFTPSLWSGEGERSKEKAKESFRKKHMESVLIYYGWGWWKGSLLLPKQMNFLKSSELSLTPLIFGKSYCGFFINIP